MRVRNVQPNILHCHDWQSAPATWGDRPNNAKAVFTIHNLNYGADLVGRAMQASEVATTVSPTYAREVGKWLSGWGVGIGFATSWCLLDALETPSCTGYMNIVNDFSNLESQNQQSKLHPLSISQQAGHAASLSAIALKPLLLCS
jgi:hypothetical protein